ncbi:MAG TPA: DUF4157 domain-containing protein, partial [Kofleriaceae bacterium]
VAQAAQPLPHLDKIQQAFGEHEVGHVKAAVGGEGGAAAGEMGARAYTAGDRVAFRDQPDLHLAAHEAAHVVQQRGGVQLKDGVGRPGDPYERQADAVADAVVGGKSAEHMLGPKQAAGGASGVQMACACGGSCASCSGGGGGAMATPAVQMEIDPASTRVWEPLSAPGVGSAAPKARESKSDGKAPAPSAPGGGAPSAPSGGGGGAEKKAEQTSKPQGDDTPAAGGGGDKPEPKAEPKDVDDAQIDKDYATADAKADADRESAATAGRTARGLDHGATRAAKQAERASKPPPEPKGCVVTVEKPEAKKPTGDKKPAPAKSGGSELDPVLKKAADEAASQACPPIPDIAADKDAKKGDDDDESCCEPLPAAAKDPSEPDPDDRDEPEDPDPAETKLHASSDSAPSGEEASAGEKPAASEAGGECKADGKKPEAEKPPEAPPPLPKAVVAPVHPTPSPLAALITSAEEQRGTAVLDADVARSAVLPAVDRLDGLAAEPVHLAADAPQSASSLLSSAFEDSARDAQHSIHDFAASVPVQLGHALANTKHQIDAAASSTREHISAAFGAARASSERAAQQARNHVEMRHALTVSKLFARTTTLLGTIEQARSQTNAAMGSAQTAALATLGQKLGAGMAAIRRVGHASGDEALAKGREWWSSYHAQRINRKDSFMKGHLTDRRANARAKAAMTSAGGYRDSFLNEAESQAWQLYRSRTGHCSTIVSSTVISQAALTEQTKAFREASLKALTDGVSQAGVVRAQLIAQIDVELAQQISQLAQREHDQRQLADDTAYLQKLAAEQMAHQTAAQLLRGVADAGDGLAQAMLKLRAQFDGQAAPAQLSSTIAQVRGIFGSAVAQLSSQANATLGRGVASVEGAAETGRVALREVRVHASEEAAKAARDFAAAMLEAQRVITDTFQEQVNAFYEAANQAHLAVKKAMHCAVLGLKAVFAGTFAQLDDGVEKQTQGLQDSFDEQIDGQLVADIRYYACKAAAQEQPAWKSVVKWVLLIAVFILALVFAPYLVAGLIEIGLSEAAAGLVADLIIGALSAAANTMINNWATGQRLTKGVLVAAAIGALTAGFARGMGGAMGAGRGLALTLGRQLVVDVAAEYVSQVANNLVEGRGFASFIPDWKGLLQAAVMSVAMHKFGAALHKRGGRVIRRGTDLGGAPHVTEPHVTEPHATDPHAAAEPPAAARPAVEPPKPPPTLAGRAKAAVGRVAGAALDRIAAATTAAEAAGRRHGKAARGALGGKPATPHAPTAPHGAGSSERAPTPTAHAEPTVREPAPTVRAPEPSVHAPEPSVRAAEPSVRAPEPAPHAREPAAIPSERPAQSPERRTEVLEPAAHASESQSAYASERIPEPGVAARLELPDGHAIKILDDGRIMFCSVCTELRAEYRAELLANPELAKRFERVEKMRNNKEAQKLAAGALRERLQEVRDLATGKPIMRSQDPAGIARREDLETQWGARTLKDPEQIKELAALRQAHGEHTYFPGTPEHMLFSYGRSSSKMKANFAQWLDSAYFRNIRNPEVGLGREHALREALGRPDSIVKGSVENTARGKRQVDAKVPARDGNLETLVQLKNEKITRLGKERHGGQLPNEEALLRDADLVDKGKRVIWVIEGSATPELLAAAKSAGVEVFVGQDAFDRVIALLNPRKP